MLTLSNYLLIRVQWKFILPVFLILSHISEAGPNIQRSIPDLGDEINISIFSDPHFYSNELGNEGVAFEDYLKNDRKLLRESEFIMSALTNQLVNEDADIILVPGDLTKDGEFMNHLKFSDYLKVIEKSGKKVYVIPGNHDIYNPHAFKYDGENKKKVSNISPEDFENIYYEFGYGEAIFRDENSLSYVVEPKPGLWILGIDCCKYDIDDDEPNDFGKIKEETLEWIGEMMDLAKAKEKLVLGMMHHNILEHFENQKTMLNGIFDHSVVDDFEEVSEYFVSKGLNYVFTGHFHANDIVMKNDFEHPGFLYDIETGSTITYPCVYRKIKILNKTELTTELAKIKGIENPELKPNFESFIMNNMSYGIEVTLSEKLDGYFFDKDEINNIVPLAVYAMLSNYTGDEITRYDIMTKINELKEKGGIFTNRIADGLQSLITDLYPADGKITINLITGEVSPDVLSENK